MPKLSRASCGAMKTSARTQERDLVLVIDRAKTAAPGWKRPASLTGDDHLEIGSSLSDQRNCGEQHLQRLCAARRAGR